MGVWRYGDAGSWVWGMGCVGEVKDVVGGMGCGGEG